MRSPRRQSTDACLAGTLHVLLAIAVLVYSPTPAIAQHLPAEELVQLPPGGPGRYASYSDAGEVVEVHLKEDGTYTIEQDGVLVEVGFWQGQDGRVCLRMKDDEQNDCYLFRRGGMAPGHIIVTDTDGSEYDYIFRP